MSLSRVWRRDFVVSAHEPARRSLAVPCCAGDSCVLVPRQQILDRTNFVPGQAHGLKVFHVEHVEIILGLP